MDFKNLYLKSDRLLIRPIIKTDLDNLFAVYSDPESMKYWSTPPITQPSQAMELIEYAEKAIKEGESLRLAVEYSKTSSLIGTLSLFNINETSKRAEVGYILSSQHWRKGIMTEAFSMLINYAFKTLNLNRLEADIDPSNLASAGLLKKCGFKHEGHFKERWIINGIASDSDIFGLLRSWWKK